MNKYKFDNSIDNQTGKQKHLHTLNGQPLYGNTSVLNVISKPLTWWASGLAVAELGWQKELNAWSKPKPTKEDIERNKIERLAKAEIGLQTISKLNSEDYLKLLDKAYKAHSVKLDRSADAGIDMHEALELYSNYCIENNNGIPMLFQKYKFIQVEIFAKWAEKNVKRFIAVEGYCYSEKLWTGGIFDCLYEDSEGKFVMLDFKSSKEAYLSHFIQDAALDIEVSENGILDTEGNLIYQLEKPISYYAVLPFGAENPEPQFYYDLVGAKKGFEAALTLHKLMS